MPERYGMSRATGVALSDEWTWTYVGNVDGDDRSEPPPPRGRLEAVEVALSDAASAPTTLTVSLARNEDGWPRLTPGNTSGATVDLEVDEADDTLASASQLLDRAFVRVTGDGGLAVGLKLDTGTATADITLTWARW